MEAHAMGRLSRIPAGYHETEPVTIRVKEPGSALTHFMGFCAALTGAPFLLKRFYECGQDAVAMLGAVVFALSMLLLYGASTSYHTFYLKSDRANLRLKKFDHLSIFVLIAGTYTPLCLTVLRNSSGPLLLGLVWGIAIVGMCFKFFWVTCPKWVSTVLYVGMGWLCVIAFPDILANMPHPAFLKLLWGGIVYTMGGILYALKLKKLNAVSPYFGSHEIFHLFVMAGNILQFMALYESV